MLQKDNIHLSKNEKQEQNKLEMELTKKLKKTDESDYNEVINKYLDSDKNIIQEKMNDKGINETADITTNNNKEIDSQYKINNDNTISFTSDGVIIDQTDESKESPATEEEEKTLLDDDTQDSLVSKLGHVVENVLFGEKAYASSSRTKSASHSRTAYSWYGSRLFTAKGCGVYI
ncbi:hypothetical protein QS257_03365 [Terrilactibacillus sp. S3-3]|nr:hypothetical protein QS257_03365 [Terrilactibacillus sp. S3-3]